MNRLIITTVGTSLLTNRDGRPWGGWNPRGNQPLPDTAGVDEWMSTADPVAVSAETNTLRGLSLTDTDHLVFLHSDTPEGRFCSARLRAFYAAGRQTDRVTEREIGSLGYNHDGFAQRGLRSLVSVTIATHADAVRRGLRPVFCATGGFKAEIAFLNLLAALLDVEAVYIHEQFRELVRLPRLPLDWNAQYVVRHRDFFDWIDAEPRPSDEVESWLRGRPELRSLVQDDTDGHTYLNAAGDLLFKAAKERLADRPRATWPDADARPPEQKNGVSAVEHHRPRGWEAFVRRLCAIDCVRRVSYDEAAYGGPSAKVLAAEAGTLAVRFGTPDLTLPLRVETTAKGAEQCELVAEYLRRLA
jgi:putative CRISPR-associated protein (TIGR02619 family)